jgi:Flp pilus assembly CpaE family ATPase
VARTLADYILVDLPSTAGPWIEEVVQHSTLTTLVMERNRMGLHVALAKMPALSKLVTRPGAVGALLVNKMPFIEFLSLPEFGKRLGCGVIAVIPPAADLHASSYESGNLPVLVRPEATFSQAIQDLGRRLTTGTKHFLAA